MNELALSPGRRHSSMIYRQLEECGFLQTAARFRLVLLIQCQTGCLPDGYADRPPSANISPLSWPANLLVAFSLSFLFKEIGSLFKPILLFKSILFWSWFFSLILIIFQVCDSQVCEVLFSKFSIRELIVFSESQLKFELLNHQRSPTVKTGPQLSKT